MRPPRLYYNDPIVAGKVIKASPRAREKDGWKTENQFRRRNSAISISSLSLSRSLTSQIIPYTFSDLGLSLTRKPRAAVAAG